MLPDVLHVGDVIIDPGFVKEIVVGVVNARQWNVLIGSRVFLASHSDYSDDAYVIPTESRRVESMLKLYGVD